jgi:hypothetical protein
MKTKPKYLKDEIVSFAGRLYKIISYKRVGFTGIEYDLEALKPDTKTGFFEKCFAIPEGFIVKK